MTHMGFYLHEEIIRNIFKRLPVKSLIRFECVCKDWQNLIKTSSFIHEHLQHSSLQPPSLALVTDTILSLRTRRLLSQRLRLLDYDMQVRGFPESPLIDSLDTPFIVGSCNGLNLVEKGVFENGNRVFNLFLWNPSTASARHVPMAPTDASQFEGFITSFGFSPTLNDYTIVRTYTTDLSIRKVDVFSLRRGSWIEVDVGNLKGVKLFSHAVTLGGAMYWTGMRIVYNEGGAYLYRIDVIVSYDIVKDEFTFIPSPKSQPLHAQDYLTIYENKVAILRNNTEGEYVVEMWVLVDEISCASGMAWSWIKRYSGSPFPGRYDPLTFWRNDIVRIRHCSNVLHLVNLTTNEVKSFDFPCHGEIVDSCNYVESLVSVGNN